jgi:aminoglycoside phosphotransferase
MDLSDVYLVVVRLPGWEFMASASHINANKAVRGLAADLQDFYEDGHD